MSSGGRGQGRRRVRGVGTLGQNGRESGQGRRRVRGGSTVRQPGRASGQGRQRVRGEGVVGQWGRASGQGWQRGAQCSASLSLACHLPVTSPRCTLTIPACPLPPLGAQRHAYPPRVSSPTHPLTTPAPTPAQSLPASLAQRSASRPPASRPMSFPQSTSPCPLTTPDSHTCPVS